MAHHHSSSTTKTTGGLPGGHRGEPDHAPHPPRRRHAREGGDGADQPLQVRTYQSLSGLSGIRVRALVNHQPPPITTNNRTSIKKDVVVYQYDVAISEASGRPIDKLPAEKVGAWCCVVLGHCIMYIGGWDGGTCVCLGVTYACGRFNMYPIGGWDGTCARRCGGVYVCMHRTVPPPPPINKPCNSPPPPAIHKPTTQARLIIRAALAQAGGDIASLPLAFDGKKNAFTITEKVLGAVYDYGCVTRVPLYISVYMCVCIHTARSIPTQSHPPNPPYLSYRREPHPQRQADGGAGPRGFGRGQGRRHGGSGGRGQGGARGRVRGGGADGGRAAPGGHRQLRDAGLCVVFLGGWVVCWGL